MTTLLRIDSSARIDGSHSRALGDYAQSLWQAENPTGQTIIRNVADGTIEMIRAETITGYYTPPEEFTPELAQATALSDKLIAELQSADTLLITAPIYNFTVPAALKAWIDQIARIDHTFSYEDGNFAGLLNANHAIVICVYGAEGYLDGQPFAAANFLQPYLQFLLGFLGIEKIDFISVQGTTNPDAVTAAEAQARVDLDRLLATDAV
ncbi:MAG TPA: FMN-dependent NADH-azoreductase [Rhodobacteraceae bacterium]|nr:FMN-dependent NADH-azoreductase [Paracoccaceae bacterium]